MSKWSKERVATYLAGAVVVFLVLFAASFNGESKAGPPLHKNMTTEEVVEFTKQVAELKRKLDAPKLKVDDLEVLEWQLELVPFFEYERFTDTPVYGNVQFIPMVSAAEHNGILGYASCSNGQVAMNLRMANPRSPWYGQPEFLSTLIHELAHVNGACGHGGIDETVAQLVTLEIMSAMVNNGNYQVLNSLLDELMDWGLGYLRAEAYDKAINIDGYGLGNVGRNSRYLDEYWALHREISPETYSAAKQRARSRSVQENLTIAFLYRREPFRLIANNFLRGEVTKLPLPRFIEPGFRYGTMPGDEPPQRSLPINDIIYFVNNMEEIVELALDERG